MKMIVAGLALAGLAVPAMAQTQAQMTAQAGAAYTRADAAMNREWRLTQAYMKGDGASSAALLLDSQRAWLKFRDAQCAIEGAETAGGTMHPMQVAGCKTRLTNERTVQLRKLRWER